MQSRLLKQCIYAAFYLVVLSGIVYVGFFTVTGGGSCTDGRKNQDETGIDCGGSCLPCELKTLKPIEATSIVTFSSAASGIVGDAGGRTAALIEFKNSNVRYGADPFTYHLVFTDSKGGSLSTTTLNSFIYPGEVKFIVVPDISAPENFSRVKVQTTDPLWREEETFVRPTIVGRGVETELRPAAREAVISGFASNESAFDLGEVTVYVSISDISGTIRAASKTVIDSLRAREERFFKVVVPGVSLGALSRDLVKISFEARRQ